MLLIHQSLVWAHIVAGSLALALFWLPMLAKKGSPLHRQSLLALCRVHVRFSQQCDGDCRAAVF